MDEQTQQQCRDQLGRLHDARFLLDFVTRHRINLYHSGSLVRAYCKGELEHLVGVGPDAESALWDLSSRMQQRRNAA